MWNYGRLPENWTVEEYQKLNTIDRTTLRDIKELMNKDIFKREGEGKNTYYRI